MWSELNLRIALNARRPRGSGRHFVDQAGKLDPEDALELKKCTRNVECSPSGVGVGFIYHSDDSDEED